MTLVLGLTLAPAGLAGPGGELACQGTAPADAGCTLALDTTMADYQPTWFAGPGFRGVLSLSIQGSNGASILEACVIAVGAIARCTGVDGGVPLGHVVFHFYTGLDQADHLVARAPATPAVPLAVGPWRAVVEVT